MHTPGTRAHTRVCQVCGVHRCLDGEETPSVLVAHTPPPPQLSARSRGRMAGWDGFSLLSWPPRPEGGLTGQRSPARPQFVGPVLPRAHRAGAQLVRLSGFASSPSAGRASGQVGGGPSRLTPGRPPRSSPESTPPQAVPASAALPAPFLTCEEFPRQPPPQLERFCRWIVAKKTRVSRLLTMQTCAGDPALPSPGPGSPACAEQIGGCWHLGGCRSGLRADREAPGAAADPRAVRPLLLPLGLQTETPPHPTPRRQRPVYPGDPQQPVRGGGLGGVLARGHTHSWGAAVSWSVCGRGAGPRGATRPGDTLARRQARPGSWAPERAEAESAEAQGAPALISPSERLQEVLTEAEEGLPGPWHLQAQLRTLRVTPSCRDRGAWPCPTLL